MTRANKTSKQNTTQQQKGEVTDLLAFINRSIQFTQPDLRCSYLRYCENNDVHVPG